MIICTGSGFQSILPFRPCGRHVRSDQACPNGDGRAIRCRPMSHSPRARSRSPSRSIPSPGRRSRSATPEPRSAPGPGVWSERFVQPWAFFPTEKWDDTAQSDLSRQDLRPGVARGPSGETPLQARGSTALSPGSAPTAFRVRTVWRFSRARPASTPYRSLDRYAGEVLADLASAGGIHGENTETIPLTSGITASSQERGSLGIEPLPHWRNERRLVPIATLRFDMPFMLAAK